MKDCKSIVSIRAVLITLALIILVLMLGQLPVWAQKPYYQGKTIEIIVPYSAGGGADIGARYLSNWLPKFIPGKPKIVVINKPGSGGRIGANYVYNVAKPDGLTMMNTSGGTNLLSLLQLTGVNFDLKKMPMVTANSSSFIHFAKAGVYNNLEEIFDKDLLIYGHLPPGGGSTTSFLLAQKLLGFKLKELVAAYRGSGDARRAFRAGEINCSSETVLGYPSHVRDYVKRGEVKIMWQTGMLDEEGKNIRFDPPIGHVPTLYDRYMEKYGKAPSGKYWEAHKTVTSNVANFDKCLVLPPGTASNIVNTVSDACVKMVNDPAFIEETKKKIKVPYMAGRKLKVLFEIHVINADKAAVEWMRGWLRDEFGVKLK